MCLSLLGAQKKCWEDRSINERNRDVHCLPNTLHGKFGFLWACPDLEKQALSALIEAQATFYVSSHFWPPSLGVQIREGTSLALEKKMDPKNLGGNF